MQNSPVLNALAIVVIAGSLGGIAWSMLPGSTDSDAAVQEEAGRALAQEAAKLGAPGGKFTVILRDTEAFPQPAVDHVKAAFEKEARRAGKTEIVYQGLQTDPLRPVQVPGGDFLEAMRRGAAGDVIVSLLGPPLLAEDKRPPAGAVKAKIVAFCPGPIGDQVDLKSLTEQGLLHAAILARSTTKGTGSNASGRRPGFDDLYMRAGAAELMNRTPGAVRP